MLGIFGKRDDETAERSVIANPLEFESSLVCPKIYFEE